MHLRTNLGNRMVLKVDAEGTSEIALGERNGGAERLLGKGHLAAKLVNLPTIVYGQVPLVSDTEIAQIVHGIRSGWVKNRGGNWLWLARLSHI